MGCLTNYSENKILDHVLKVMPFSRPATLYLAMCKSDPGEVATGATLDEPSGGAYSRKAVNVWDAAAGRATANTNKIEFDQATASWGTLTHWAVVDSGTIGAGNVLAYGALSAPKTVNLNDNYFHDAGTIDISVDAGKWSNYLANAILDHLFAGTPYTPPTDIYIALATAAIVDSDTGSTLTEPGDTYARQKNNTWNPASGGATSNAGAIAFPASSAGYGTVTHAGLCDHATAGNLLMHKSVVLSKGIGSGDITKFPAGTFQITLD